ncbi:MAG: RDD family protein [Gammaproteobacteria bacterium]
MSRDPAVVGLRRRFGALLYDAIAAIAVLYFAAFAPVVASGGALAPGNLPFMLYLLLVLFGYFGLGWTRGRTIGMQAWKIEIVSVDGGRPRWDAAGRRFLAAALSLALGGAGYLVALADPARRTWPDRWSRTRLVRQGRFTVRGNS